MPDSIQIAAAAEYVSDDVRCWPVGTTRLKIGRAQAFTAITATPCKRVLSMGRTSACMGGGGWRPQALPHIASSNADNFKFFFSDTSDYDSRSKSAQSRLDFC